MPGGQFGDYTIRNISPELHKTWKAASALLGMTMREYVFRALRNQTKQDLKTNEAEND